MGNLRTKHLGRAGQREEAWGPKWDRDEEAATDCDSTFPSVFVLITQNIFVHSTHYIFSFLEIFETRKRLIVTFPEEPRSPRRGKARNSDRSQFRPVFHLLTCPSQRELHKKEESDNEEDQEHIHLYRCAHIQI